MTHTRWLQWLQSCHVSWWSDTAELKHYYSTLLKRTKAWHCLMWMFALLQDRLEPAVIMEDDEAKTAIQQLYSKWASFAITTVGLV